MTHLKSPLAILLPNSFPDSLSQLLFEQHWLYWIPLAAAGLALAWFARGANEKIVRRAGFAMLILAALWCLAAMVFVTPRERLASAHRRILKAAESGDPQAIIDLMSPDFHFGPADKSATADSITAVLKTIRSKSNLIRFYQADLTGADADVHINILTTLDPANSAPPGPYLSKWELFWKDAPPDDTHPDGWQITEIHRWWLSDGTNDQPMPNNFSDIK